jgi:hypothetical protein
MLKVKEVEEEAVVTNRSDAMKGMAVKNGFRVVLVALDDCVLTGEEPHGEDQYIALCDCVGMLRPLLVGGTALYLVWPLDVTIDNLAKTKCTLAIAGLEGPLETAIISRRDVRLMAQDRTSLVLCNPSLQYHSELLQIGGESNPA